MSEFFMIIPFLTILGFGFGGLLVVILNQAYGLLRREKIWIIIGWVVALFFCGYSFHELGLRLSPLPLGIGGLVMALAIQKSFKLTFWEVLLITLSWIAGPQLLFFLIDNSLYAFPFLGPAMGLVGGITSLTILIRAQKRQKPVEETEVY